VLVKASAQPLGDFYQEHAAPFTPAAHDFADTDSVCLDKATAADYLYGWHTAEDFPPLARWLARRGLVRFTAAPIRKITLDLMSHLPDLETNPLTLEFRLNGVTVCQHTLAGYGWQTLEFEVAPVGGGLQTYELEIIPSRTWQPCRHFPGNGDDRELSIAVRNLEIRR
jgi:hypothetical protein